MFGLGQTCAVCWFWTGRCNTPVGGWERPGPWGLGTTPSGGYSLTSWCWTNWWSTKNPRELMINRIDLGLMWVGPKIHLGLTRVWPGLDWGFIWVWPGFDVGLDLGLIWVWPGCDPDLTCVWHGLDVGLTCFSSVFDPDLTWVWSGYDLGLISSLIHYGPLDVIN